MSIVLTTGLGFVMFGITFFKQKLIKYFLILSVPLVWHALILFASRGALLSAAAVTLFFVMVMRSKTLNLAVLAGFTAMLIWQGAMLTSRTTSTVAQAQQENVDVPLNPRLVSWGVGIDIALEHPLLGAGPQRFQYASAVLFPGKSPHVAHNTFLNFSANTGIIAGLIYLSFFIVSFKQYKYVRKYKQGDTVNGYINLACAGGLVGYFVGAIFLDLIVFEPFYFLLVLMSVNYCMVKAGSVSPSPG
jgi:O-antigen ligase